ncbi:FAD-binding oxidoreductase [Aliiroseovarius subalbicans]|uniref:NAD(P)/FAD-dependent oxidoreductase n=1 Tax=Aliiroseovarius subalbicans TaxID=2925840 RepID=UPI001F580939|nr:FAD-binding oxidoreductase [Aliiroseovarius subalbicans]MCI2397857.1 FAD-binding oxidoreductase [Aliiroseovarius subalbicans]
MTQTNLPSENVAGYIDSYYTRTSQAQPARAPLKGLVEADVCVVGGGIAGVSAAWELAQRGKSVVLLEAKRIAWGASGRNGGLLSSGFAASTGSIRARSGQKAARALHDLSHEGIRAVLDNTRNLALPGVDPIAGVILASRHPDTEGLKAWQREANDVLGENLDYLPPDKMRELVKSERYFDGMYDPDGYHIHPLNYCLGLAENLVASGGQVFENSSMTAMNTSGTEKVVKTENGTVKARHLVLCGSGYGGHEFGRVHHAVLPIATYVISTRGLGDRIGDIMATPAAVADTRLSCDYFRVTPTGELLWGGGMSAMAKEPENLTEMMKARVVEVFPQIADVEVDVAWTGLMGYARHKMPYLQEVQPEVWTATALGGHGLNTGPALGKVLAETIAENGKRHELFAPYGLRWNGSFAGAIVADTICAASNFAHRRKER